MKKRVISGACYVAIILGVFLLRGLVDTRLFQILPLFFCSLGTFEIARALKTHLFKGWYSLSIIFGILFIPQYAVLNYFIWENYGIFFAIALSQLLVLITIVVALIKKCSFKKFLVNVLPFIYPSLLILTMSYVSDIADKYYSLIALLLIFAIPAIADSFAQLTGMAYNKIRKGQAKKLCPKLSPNKTVAGGIGGIVGGIIIAVVLYFIFKSKCDISIWIYLIIGVVGSVLDEIGDLFESYIKRKVGIKDMGKIMPGHGGIMDRIDGMSFVSLFVCLVFILIM
ncbi:MAG: phosphatidate cytidylyltransferase [Clostridia bacterium]|nr:phosphatidate cytidylyltransferase [Clostridia bacterium]